MGNQTQDDRKPNQQGAGGQDQNRDRSQTGRPSSGGAGQEETGNQARSTQAGGMKQGAGREPREDNSIDRTTDDEGAGRDRQAGGRTGQAGEQMDEGDIERPDVQEKSDRNAPGSRPR